MDFVVLNVVRQQGVGAKSGKPYDFIVAQGLVQTARGPQMCEVVLEKDHPALVNGTKYHVEIELFPDREKRLAMRVVGLRPAESVRKVG